MAKNKPRRQAIEIIQCLGNMPKKEMPGAKLVQLKIMARGFTFVVHPKFIKLFAS